MQLADCCMAVSGSVSLELLYHTKPTVIVYRISKLAYQVQRVFRKVRYITLVNLLAADDPFSETATEMSGEAPQQMLFPEYLTCDDKSDEIAAHVVQWLADPAARKARIDDLARLKARVAQGGASRRAAEYILAAIEKPSAKAPRPHFMPNCVPRESATTASF
jgi:lipid-A-disaccharide synthase